MLIDVLAQAAFLAAVVGVLFVLAMLTGCVQQMERGKLLPAPTLSNN